MKTESDNIERNYLDFYESDFYGERLEAVSNRLSIEFKELYAKEAKKLKPIPNKKDSVYETLIYDGGN